AGMKCSPFFLKIRWWKHRAGSSPARGTKLASAMGFWGRGAAEHASGRLRKLVLPVLRISPPCFAPTLLPGLAQIAELIRIERGQRAPGPVTLQPPAPEFC